MQLKAYGTYRHFFTCIGNKECLHLHYCTASGCELCDDFCYHIKRYNFNKVNVHIKKKNLSANAGDVRGTDLTFDPWIRKIPWRRKWQPTPLFFFFFFLLKKKLLIYFKWRIITLHYCDVFCHIST